MFAQYSAIPQCWPLWCWIYPKSQRGKALKYGIIGAYVFRGICLIFAAYLIQFLWLKAVGGIFLIWLCADYFITKKTPEPEDDLLSKKENWFYRFVNKHFGKFWSTVASLVMDLAFSMDNVFVHLRFPIIFTSSGSRISRHIGHAFRSAGLC